MNVQEVINIGKERKLKSKRSTFKLIENIHKKIKKYAELNKESCTYIIPPIVDDVPLYNREEIVKDIFKILDSEGYIVNAYSNGQIDISWNESLVEQKIKTDRFLMKEQESKLLKMNKKMNLINDRYALLANPIKINKELSIEEKLDQQIEKNLQDREKQQKKFSKMLKVI